MQLIFCGVVGWPGTNSSSGSDPSFGSVYWSLAVEISRPPILLWPDWNSSSDQTLLFTLTAGFAGSGWHIGFAAKCTQIILAGAGLVVGVTVGVAEGFAVGFDVGRAVGLDGLRPVALAVGVGDELLAGVGELPAGVGVATGVGELPVGVGELPTGVGVLPTGVAVPPGEGVAEPPPDGDSDARGVGFTGEI